MSKIRLISGFLAILGLSLLVVVVAMGAEVLGALAWVLILGGAFLVAAWIVLLRSRPAKGGDLEGLRAEIERQSARLEKQRVELRQQRAAHFALEEFPDFEMSSNDDEMRANCHPAEPCDWEERDARVVALMREESERLFRNLIDNAYVKDGQFDRSRLGDDLACLVESVARIYQPDSEHPLLETSVEKLLRAVNRASVQMLVHVEQLPLDVKAYNLREAYQYVRSAAKYYGYYKKVEPYWTYGRPLFQLGRLALGANPITLGVGWAMSELVKYGSVNFAHSYALRLFHDTVRILGNETAGIFGGDYRHRDPSWIYGVEIVTLTLTFAPSRDRLECALREVSALALRSEYDRIYLYGCLAQGKVPHPERFMGRDFLSLGGRQQIASRIESHCRKLGLESEATVFSKWQRTVEERLGVRLRIGSGQDLVSDDEALVNALRALASFLIQFKGKDPAEIAAVLRQTRLLGGLDSSAAAEALNAVTIEPPMLFEIPLLNPGSPQVRAFLEELLELEVKFGPRFPLSAQAIEETAGYLREETAKWRELLDRRYTDFLLRECLAGCSDAKKFPQIAASFALALLDEGESLTFFFDGVGLVPAQVSGNSVGDMRLTLCGTKSRLLLLASDREHADLLWIAEREDVVIEKVRNVISDDCEISGGSWRMDAENVPRAVIIAGKKLVSYEKRFRLLLDWRSGA